MNSLNQPPNVTRSATLTVAGNVSHPATSVTVWGAGRSSGTATLYPDNTWARAEANCASANNTYNAMARDSQRRQDTTTVAAYLLASLTCTYDANGNLLSDGRRGFQYDDENQLISVTVSNSWKSEFVYDGKMRRRIRREYVWQSGVWSLQSEIRYVYDGNLVIQERSNNGNIPLVTYTRGPDLSGTLEGAGGIGGLLARSENGLLAIGDPGASAYYAPDGNGNITCLVNTNGAIVAKYLYDPYGNILAQSGVLADVNLYRFSSKEFHGNSGLVYYLYRYYEPSFQRWLNRDPIGERGGANLYSFVVNQPTRFMDRWGLAPCGGDWGGYLWPPFQGPSLPSRGNCWRYACGDPAKPGETHRRRPPGWLNALQPSCPDPCRALMDGINGAGGKSPDPTSGKCPPGTHKISVQYSSSAYGGQPDYHFARECPDGTWSDKPGQMAPKPISGPDEAAPGYKKCGETCVPDNWDTDTIGSP